MGKCIITNEFLETSYKDKLVHVLKCDLPIWKEFLLGFEYCDSRGLNDNFCGVRSWCGKICHSNTYIYKEVCIVTRNPKSQSFFERVYMEHYKTNSYKSLNITKYERGDKDVYVIEYSR